MGLTNKDLLKRLRAAFKAEAEDRLKIINSDLVELEKKPAGDKYDEVIESIFRQTHSLKGAARSADLPVIEKISGALEDIFSALKRNEIKISFEMTNVLYDATDTLADLAATPESEHTNVHGNQISKIIKQIKELSSGKSVNETKPVEKEPKPVDKLLPAMAIKKTQKEIAPQPEPAAPQKKGQEAFKEADPQTQTIRVSINKLDSLMLQAEEILQAKLLANRHKNELQDLIEMLELWKKDWAQITTATHALSQMINKETEPGRKKKTALVSLSKLIELIESNQNQSRLFEDRLLALFKSAHQDKRLVGELVDRLLEDMKDVLMLPFSFFLEMIPKIVRDLARDQNKKVKVSMEGGDVEINRKILEEMKDPLIHLLRNCVDHGIEKSEIRKKNKKPETGTVNVIISQTNSDKIEIIISDDGEGIDIKKVKEAAIKKKVISRQEASELSEKEALDLIFQSDVTTSLIITDISGRGLGMAIVREKIERLGGEVSVESTPGKGTKFRALLPITLATFRGILVSAGEQQFIIPTVNVDRVVRVRPDDIKTVENKETILLNGKTVPLVRLDDVLEIHHKERVSASETYPALVLGTGEKRIAFSLDKVLDEEEILFKSLGKQLSRVRNIYGATVLGNRKVVPILNVMDLMKSAVHISPMSAEVPVRMEEQESEKISVLVAEDSITSRMLLKTILESAGYQVKTVVDGLEALTELKEGEYNLLVSDVDMPRMNGFVLTGKIREDKKLGDLPVILVTALHSREDRERGIDVGANAYIVKSSFDQSNLLEVVKKYI
ncbi:hybrid sensor histidine kinase/response regulator [Desulfobacula toluolica]|uniref:histidine kinase n=1 Tax=Desulfobacula toluolica (strain DSM 7467 / Tol2) TaxID=651182 RepID=K0NGL5_DESTT|nr:response regulator [Desulfobacula toluolica]CCK80060.1 CheA2: chemotaxis protein A, histidine kinase [Desulfobacula toluolica Tol2]